MPQQEERHSVYIIPENYIEGGRILNGEFKTRYFIEACIAAAIFLVIALLITKELTRNLRVVITTFIVVVPFFVCLNGINGDPVSIFLRSSLHWLFSKKLMKYNETPQPLAESPLDASLERESTRDKLYDMMESSREKKAARIAMEKQTKFAFKQDLDIVDHLYDPDEDETNDHFFISYTDEDENELSLNETEDAAFTITIEDDDDELEALRKEVLNE